MQIDRPIAIAITLFAVLLLAFFLVAPEYKTFKALQLDLAQKNAEYNAKFDYYAAVAKSYFELQSRPEDLKKIDDALPENTDLGKIIYFMQQTAKENGLIFKDLFLSKVSAQKPEQGGAAGGINDIVFSVDLLGTFASLGNFIDAIEKSSRIFEITNISFGSTENSFSLQIKTHSY